MQNFPVYLNYKTMKREPQINNYLNQMIPLTPFSQLLHATLTAQSLHEEINNLHAFVHLSTIPPSSHSDYPLIVQRLEQVSQKNKQLLRRTLNLRVTIANKMYLSQKIESQDRLRKYEYIKKDIINLKENLHKGFRVAKNIKHFQLKLSQKKQNRQQIIQQPIKLNSVELNSIKQGLALLLQDCERCKLELNLIDSVWCKNKKA